MAISILKSRPLVYKSLYIIGFFFPAWVASLLLWGDDRTSYGFQQAPLWFNISKQVLQTACIIMLLKPLKFKKLSLDIDSILILSLIAASISSAPALEAEFILIQSSLKIAILLLFLTYIKTSAKWNPGDINLIFNLFTFGFIFQIALYILIGHLPAHSIPGLLIRFNGVTNDGLSTSLILPMFIPLVVRSKKRNLKLFLLFAMAVLTGSSFAIIAVPLLTLAYLAHNREFKLIGRISIVSTILVIIYFSEIISLLEIKSYSILTHLRFFLNIFKLDYGQPLTDCAEAFCESFFELGFYMNPIYAVLVYIVYMRPLYFLIRYRPNEDSVAHDSVIFLGISLLIATLVHPVPLIPFASQLFFITAAILQNSPYIHPIKKSY